MEKIFIDFNSQVRNIVVDYINKYLETGLDVKSSAAMFVGNYNAFLQNEKQMPVALYMLSVMYLDAYKIYSFKQKNSMLNEGDEDFLGLLTDIEDADELVEEATDPNFLVKLIISTYEFSEYNALAKINLVKSLSDAETAWLKERFEVHSQDVDHYDIDIDLDFLVTNAKRHMKHQSKLGYEFQDGIVINLVGFIRNLFNIRRHNAIKLILELIKVDYAASKYLVDKVSDNESFVDHIDLYENYSVDDMIDVLISNQSFLADSIWMLLATYVFNEYDDIEINSELVKSKGTEEFNKKLIFE